MQALISQYLAGMGSELDRRAVRIPINAIGDRMSSQTLNTAALRILGGSASPIVQTNAAALIIANAKLVKLATATSLPALSGSVANGTFNVFIFTIDQAGNLFTQMGQASTSLLGVIFPQMTQGRAMLGFVVINPTGTGAFVGGTTALDDATVVPNAVFANTLGAFDPSISL